nr:unnamed protein product [Callosobruchus analis]
MNDQILGLLDGDTTYLSDDSVRLRMTASYLIKKPPLPDLEGEVDLCNAFTAPPIPQVSTFLDVFSLPGKCPLSPNKYCADRKKSVSIAKFKNGLALVLGTTTGKLKLKHDGGPSCVEFSFVTSKSASG